MPELLFLVAEGLSLRKACEQLGIDAPSAHHLIDADPELRQQYARAKELRGEVYAEQVLTVAGAVVAKKIKPDAGRVAIDAYKWAAARMAPKAWGDKQTHEHTGADGGPIEYRKMSREARQARIAELEARRAERSGGA